MKSQPLRSHFLDFPEIQEQSPTVQHADIKRQFQQCSKRWMCC